MVLVAALEKAGHDNTKIQNFEEKHFEGTKFEMCKECQCRKRVFTCRVFVEIDLLLLERKDQS